MKLDQEEKYVNFVIILLDHDFFTETIERKKNVGVV